MHRTWLRNSLSFCLCLKFSLVSYLFLAGHSRLQEVSCKLVLRSHTVQEFPEPICLVITTPNNTELGRPSRCHWWPAFLAVQPVPPRLLGREGGEQRSSMWTVFVHFAGRAYDTRFPEMWMRQACEQRAVSRPWRVSELATAQGLRCPSLSPCFCCSLLTGLKWSTDTVAMGLSCSFPGVYVPVDHAHLPRDVFWIGSSCRFTWKTCTFV